MPIPDYQSLMMPLLRASSNQSEVKIGPLTDIIADQLGLTSDERSELLPSGKQSVLGNRINWAKTYLAQAGLLESTRRGHFKITARGQEALSKNLSKIDNSYLRQFDEFQKFVGRVRSSQPPSPQAESETSGGMETPDETMRRAQTQINRCASSRSARTCAV